MAKVTLKRDWFDTEGKLWAANRSPHTMSEELLEGLPSDAKIEREEEEEKPKAKAEKLKL